MEKILANALGQDVAQLPDEEKRLLLSRLLARFAHEIRNPLSSLDLHVQLLEEDLREAPKEIKEKSGAQFEIIRGELHRLDNIVKQFLSLACPSAIHLEPTDPAGILRHVCDLLGPEAKTHGITMTLRTGENLPIIDADPAQITQALINVVINAIQAVGQDGKVEVGGRLDPDGGALWIEVLDSGPGIPADKCSAIFEPFFTTKEDGTGLGLWIVRQIVSAHGGGVFAGNLPEGGAVLTLRLPLRRREAMHE